MSNVKVECAFSRPYFIGCLNRQGNFDPKGAALVLATTPSSKTKPPRLFVHRMRYTNFDAVDKAIAVTNKRGWIDPDVWVEIELMPYLSAQSVITTDGVLIRKGVRSSEFNESLSKPTDHAETVSNLERLEGGWSLL